MSKLIATAVLSIALGFAGTALAQKAARHGGQTAVVAGHHDAELVVKPDALVLYLTNHGKPLIPADNAAATGFFSAHSSLPLVPLSALKKSVVPAPVMNDGFDPAVPARMSDTKTVPGENPVLFHNSRPWASVTAEKNRVLL